MLSLLIRATYCIKDFFNGSPIKKEYDDIMNIQRGGAKAEDLRKNHLRDLLEFAVRNCKFYSSYDSNNLSSFPVTNKAILRQNADIIIVPVNLIPGQKYTLKFSSIDNDTISETKLKYKIQEYFGPNAEFTFL